MSKGFYPRLAFESMRKNRRLYLPYLLTCTGMVMMEYIMLYLESSQLMRSLRGGNSIRLMMGLGVWVIALFACLFLFYTNSFLMRRRKREFGLYNILGMGKGNIGVILLWETLIIGVSSLLAGLLLGVAFSKLAELILVNIMGESVSFTLSVSLPSVKNCAVIFAAIFALLYLNALRQVKFTSAIGLLHSENLGEKPPRANWALGLAGFALLGAAYYMAVTVQDPLAAMLYFFLAVLMVIVGTYLVMIAGSVLICRLLQRNKRYYYRANHFVSISSMAYRMKRNGAGLASICILATMVLVMLSSTSCLYAGSETSMRERYPREINVTVCFEGPQDLSDENTAAVRSDLADYYAAQGARSEHVLTFRYLLTAVMIENGVIVPRMDYSSLNGMVRAWQLYLIPLADYNAMTGAGVTLDADEVLMETTRTSYAGDTLTLPGGETFRVRRTAERFEGDGGAAAYVNNSLMLFVADPDAFGRMLFGDEMERMSGYMAYGFDTGLSDERQCALERDLGDMFAQYGHASRHVAAYSVESRAAEQDDFYGTYGGMFFLGLFLSVVFIFAAVLIIYYKQISEGYEDQARFEIMQKVGMTKKEIRRSVNSQLLTVFFLPLLMAACHLCFAFPMIRKLLMLFALDNVPLFAATTGISFLAFALLYMLVYRITSNAYYGIVSGVKPE